MRISDMKLASFVLVLTSIFPDPDDQRAHDDKVKEWLGKDALTVLDMFDLPDAPAEGDPVERMDWLVARIRQIEPEILDCSIDHYWRDVLEEATGLPVIHRPFPVK
ncbi:MAG: hypothetical protein DRJ08_06330 [Acidobacteria bacterium]|nr:MAG: hypothetical protein DRJ08_06330 [Acidobacteriota bacterium]